MAAPTKEMKFCKANFDITEKEGQFFFERVTGTAPGYIVDVEQYPTIREASAWVWQSEQTPMESIPDNFDSLLELKNANKGNYQALHGEIVGMDCYNLKTLNLVPDSIIDLGANCGIFTNYCRELWPQSNIIAVEPDDENFAYLNQFSKHPKTTLLKKAIGAGKIYKIPNALNGAHESYLSDGLSYSQADLEKLEATEVESLMLTDLSVNGKSILKVDIEGNDMVLIADPQSREMIKQFDYIAFEVHNFAADHDKVKDITKKMDDFISELRATHNISIVHTCFFATKK
jgi:FkbM family methyltransferase